MLADAPEPVAAERSKLHGIATSFSPEEELTEAAFPASVVELELAAAEALAPELLKDNTAKSIRPEFGFKSTSSILPSDSPPAPLTSAPISLLPRVSAWAIRCAPPYEGWLRALGLDGSGAIEPGMVELSSARSPSVMLTAQHAINGINFLVIIAFLFVLVVKSS